MWTRHRSLIALEFVKLTILCLAAIVCVGTGEYGKHVYVIPILLGHWKQINLVSVWSVTQTLLVIFFREREKSYIHICCMGGVESLLFLLFFFSGSSQYFILFVKIFM